MARNGASQRWTRGAPKRTGANLSECASESSDTNRSQDDRAPNENAASAPNEHARAELRGDATRVSPNKSSSAAENWAGHTGQPPYSRSGFRGVVQQGSGGQHDCAATAQKPTPLGRGQGSLAGPDVHYKARSSARLQIPTATRRPRVVTPPPAWLSALDLGFPDRVPAGAVRVGLEAGRGLRLHRGPPPEGGEPTLSPADPPP